METKNLCQGVDLHILKTPKFKTNLMSVYLTIPFKRDSVTYVSLLSHVLKRGSKNYPTLKDMSRRLDDLYCASLSCGTRVKGDSEALFISSEYISDAYIGENLTQKIAELISDILFSPLTENGGFKSDYVDGEKENLKNTILGIINDKKEYAEAKCREAMFGKTGFGMLSCGYEEDLPHITPVNLYEFYLDVLKTAKVDIFLSGNITDGIIEDTKKLLASSFSPRSAKYLKTEIAKSSENDINYVTEDADVVQSKLCIGLHCNTEPTSKEYNALALASCIFGGSPYSKLFTNVREKLSLAYYVSSKISMFQSVMLISSGIQTENYQKALDEIMLQFDKMQKGEFSDFEITAAKKYLVSSYLSMSDSIKLTEDYFLSRTILGSDADIDALISDIQSIKKDEITEAMKKVKFDTVYFLKGHSKEAENI